MGVKLHSDNQILSQMYFYISTYVEGLYEQINVLPRFCCSARPLQNLIASDLAEEPDEKDNSIAVCDL